ncbi:SH3 domain-containing protein [Streptomyces sp. NPDC000878]
MSDLDSRSWPRQTSGVSANQRSGSSTSCGVTGYADNQNVLDYHCYTVSSSGSTWTYLRNDTDGTYGWVSDSLLPDNGSLVYCGF